MSVVFQWNFAVWNTTTGVANCDPINDNNGNLAWRIFVFVNNFATVHLSRKHTFIHPGAFFAVVKKFWLAAESEVLVLEVDSFSKMIPGFTPMRNNKGLVL